MLKDKLVIVRGGGDIATGTIHRLHRSGFRVLVLETKHPAAIRRQVSFCEAVYEGKMQIEGVTGIRVGAVIRTEADMTRKVQMEIENIWDRRCVPILVDPAGASIKVLQPEIVIDAILAKKNLGTSCDMAPLTIGFGPGFTAGEDVDIVIETMRGHNLGRIITEGAALADTGIPGNISGYTKERVLHSPEKGIVYLKNKIGDVVEKGEVVMEVHTEDGRIVPVNATIPGIIRGLIKDGFLVKKGFKIGDIDPRAGELENCFTISDKARCIAGSVLEVVCGFFIEAEENAVTKKRIV